MKNLKIKLISVIVLLGFVGNICVCNAYAADSILNDLNSLGITYMLGVESRMESNITRGEFSQLVINMMGQREIAESLITYNYFTDIEDSPYKGAINLLMAEGYVSGTGNGKFEPENYITYNQICKIMVSVLGYDVIVSDSSLESYAYAAGSIGITKNVDSSQSILKIKDVLTIIDNCLDIDKMVPMYYNDDVSPSYEIDEGNTLRNDIMNAVPYGLAKIKGIVTADVSCYLYFQRDAMKDSQIEVDGVLYNCEGKAPVGFVGMEVEMYVSVADNQYDKVVSVSATNKNTVTEVNGYDTVKFDEDELEYIVQGTQTKKVSIDKNAKYIYNSNIDSEFDSSKIALKNTVSIRLIDNNNDGLCDVVFVYEYESRVAKSIFAETKTITLNKEYNGGINLNLDDDNTGLRVEYFDNNGVVTDFDSIELNDVLSIASSKDGYNIRVVVSKDKITGCVEGKGDDYYTVNGVDYTFANDISALRLNSNIEAYLDFCGNIVYFKELDKPNDYAYVYAVQIPSSRFGDIKVKLITPGPVSSKTLDGTFDESTNAVSSVTKLYVSNKSVLVYSLDSKVNVSGTRYTSERAAELVKNKAVRYYLDNSGKVNKFELLTPLYEYEYDAFTGDYVTDGNGNYTVKSETVNQRLSYNSTEKIFAKGPCLPFGINDSTVAACIPVADSMNDLSVVSVSDTELLNFKMELSNGIKQTVSAYEVDEDIHIAPFIVLAQTASTMSVGSDGTLQAKKKNVGLVVKSSWILDSETQETVLNITMLTMGRKKQLEEQSFTKSTLIVDKSEFSEITKGDLILYSLDNFDNVDNVMIIKKFSDREKDGLFSEGTDKESYVYNVRNIDFDEIDRDRGRWVDKITLCSSDNPDNTVKYFNIPQNTNLAPVVFAVNNNRDAKPADIKDICINDRICVYNPESLGDVAAIVIYR